MFRTSRFFLSYAAAFLIVTAGPIAAQMTSGEETGSYGSEPSPEAEGTSTGRSPTTQVSSVAQLTTRLSQMKSMCSGSGEFVVDCLAERIQALGLDATNLNGHREMKQILEDTAEELRLLVRANSDRTAPRAKITSKDGQRSSRPLVAVAPDQRAQVQRQAIAILEEAETKLLRSSTQSAARASQYQQVAEALGSNKVLLRS